MHYKGEDPCALGAPLEACSACSSLKEVEWNHLRTVFQERSAKHAAKTLLEPEPDSEGELETCKMDDSILDLKTEERTSGTGQYYRIYFSNRSISTSQSVATTASYNFRWNIFSLIHHAATKVHDFPGCPSLNTIYYGLFQDTGASSNCT